MHSGGSQSTPSTDHQLEAAVAVDNEGSAISRVKTASPQQPVGWIKRQLWRIRYRRSFLVNRRQLRTTLLILGLVFALLILVNLALYALRSADDAGASVSVLKEVMQEADQNEMLMIILASVVVLAGVFVVTIIETHRTAGAAFAVGRQMRRVADGHLDVALQLRRGDNLRELEGPFNDMIDSLKDQANEDVAILERLANDVKSAQTDDDAARVAAELRDLAARKRHQFQ